MIAYNRTALDHRALLENAENWHSAGQIDDEKLAEIRTRFRDTLYSPNWPVRIGLAFFGFFLFSAGVGLVFMFFSLATNENEGFSFMMMLAGVGGIFVLEKLLIGEKKHFRSGLDDVFLYGSLWNFIVGCLWLFDFEMPFEMRCLLVAMPCIWAAIRYADTLAALGGLLATFGLFISLVNRLAGSNAALVLPLAAMIFALSAYFLIKKRRQNPETRFWEMPFDFLEAATLLLFYAAGNFFSIKTGAVEFFGMENVPLPWFFWGFTLLAPLGMIGLGLYRKDRILLDIGLFLVAISLATVRYFHSVMPISWAATLGGAVLLVVAWLGIRYLRTNSERFTFARDGRASTMQRLQSVVIDRATAANEGRPPNSPVSGSDF